MRGVRLVNHALAGRASVEEPDDVESARALDDVARIAGGEVRDDVGEQRRKGGGGPPVEGSTLGRPRAGRMATRERGKRLARPKAPQHVFRRRPRLRIPALPGDEDVTDEILFALGRRPFGPGEISGDFLVADPDPVDYLPPAHALNDEIVADPFPEVRERNAARLERTAEVRQGGVVPAGDGLDGAVDPSVGDAQPVSLRDAELQPFEDELVERTAHQRLLGGQAGPRLPEVEDEVAEPPLDLAHQDDVAVDHRRDPVELGCRARQRKEEDRGSRDRGRREAAQASHARGSVGAGQNGFR